MLSKIVSGAVAASILLVISASTGAFAADTPKDKAACEKAGMKWDDKTNTCVKK